MAGAVSCSCGRCGLPHLRNSGSATQLVIDGQPLLLLAGEVHHSSSSSLKYLQPISLTMTFAVLVVCAVMLAAGCSKRSSAPVSLAPAVPPAPEPTLNSPPPASAPAVQPVAVTDDGNLDSTLSQLTQVLRKFSMEQRRVPKSFDEVVAAGYVSGMPQPPQGKRFAIDAKRVQVVLVKQ